MLERVRFPSLNRLLLESVQELVPVRPVHCPNRSRLAQERK